MPRDKVKENVLATDWDKEFTKSSITLNDIRTTNLPKMYAEWAIKEIKKKGSGSIKDILLKACERRNETNERRNKSKKTAATEEPEKKRQPKTGIKKRQPLTSSKEPGPILIDNSANVLENEKITSLFRSVLGYQNGEYGNKDPGVYEKYDNDLNLLRSTWRKLTRDQQDALASTYGEAAGLDSDDDFIQDSIKYDDSDKRSDNTVPSVLIHYDLDGGNEGIMKRAFIFDVKRALEANYSLNEIKEIINRERKVLDNYYNFQRVSSSVPEDKIPYVSTYRWFNDFFIKQATLIRSREEIEGLRDEYYRETDKTKRENLLGQIKQKQEEFDNIYENVNPIYHKINVSKFDKRKDPIYVFTENDEKQNGKPKTGVSQDSIKEIVFGKNLAQLRGIKDFEAYKNAAKDPYYNLDWLRSMDIDKVAEKTFNYYSGSLRLTAAARENWPTIINEVKNDTIISYLPLIGGNVINATNLQNNEKHTLLRDLSVIRDDLFKSTELETQIIDIAKAFYYINRVISQIDGPSDKSQLDLIKHPADIDWTDFVSNQPEYKGALDKEDDKQYDEAWELVDDNRRTTKLILALADAADYLNPFFDDTEPMEIDDKYINLPVVIPKIDDFRVAPFLISQQVLKEDGTTERVYKYPFNRDGEPQFKYEKVSSKYEPGLRWNIEGVQRLVNILRKASVAASVDEYQGELESMLRIDLDDSDEDEDADSNGSVFVDNEETESTMWTTGTGITNTAVSFMGESAVPLASRHPQNNDSTLTLTTLGTADQTRGPSSYKASSTGTGSESRAQRSDDTSSYSSVHTSSDPANEGAKYKQERDNLQKRIEQFFHSITSAFYIDRDSVTVNGPSVDHLTNLEEALKDGYRTVSRTIQELQNQVLSNENEKRWCLDSISRLQQEKYNLEAGLLYVQTELENTRQYAHEAINSLEATNNETLKQMMDSYNTLVEHAKGLGDTLNSNSTRSNEEKEALLKQITELKQDSNMYMEVASLRSMELDEAKAKIMELEKPNELYSVGAQTSPMNSVLVTNNIDVQTSQGPDDSKRLKYVEEILSNERGRLALLENRLTELNKELEIAKNGLAEQVSLNLESTRKHAEDKTALQTEIDKLTVNNGRLQKSINDFLSVLPSSHRTVDMGLTWLRDLASNRPECDTRDNTSRPGPDSNASNFNSAQQIISGEPGLEDRTTGARDFLTLNELNNTHRDLLVDICKDNKPMADRLSRFGIQSNESQVNQTVVNSGAEQIVQRIITPANVGQLNNAYRTGTGVQMSLTGSLVHDLVNTVGSLNDRWFKNRGSVLQTHDLNGSSARSVRFQGFDPLSSNGTDFNIVRRSGHVRQSSGLRENVIDQGSIGRSSARLGPVLNVFNPEGRPGVQSTDTEASFIQETRAERQVVRDASGNDQPPSDREHEPSDNGNTSGEQTFDNSSYAYGLSGVPLGGGGPGGNGPPGGGGSGLNLNDWTSSSSSSINPAFRSHYDLRRDIDPYLDQSAPGNGILKEDDMDNVTKILSRAAGHIEAIKDAFNGKTKKDFEAVRSLYYRQLKTRLNGLKDVDMDRLRRINQTEQRYNEFLIRQEQAHQQHVYNTTDMKHKMSLERLRNSQARLTDRHRAVLSRHQDVFKSDLSFSERMRDDSYSDYRVGRQNTERITNRAFLNSKISDLIGKLAGQVDPTLASFGQELVINHLKDLVSLTDEDLRGVRADEIIKMIDDGTVDRLIKVMAAKNQNNVNDSLSKRMSDLENTVRSVINIATQRTAHIGHLQAYSPPRRVFVRRDGKAYQGNRSVRVGRTRRLPPRTKHGRFKKATTRRVKK